MKYKLIDKLIRIGDYSILKDKLYFIKNKYVIEYPDKDIIKLSDYWGVSFMKDFFNVFTNRSFNTFYNYSGELINTYDKTNFYFYFSQSDFIYFDRDEKATKYNDIVICDGKIGDTFLYKNRIFIFKINTIECVYYETSSHFWHFSFSQLGTFKTIDGEEKPYEVQKFIGVYKDILWVQLKNNQGLIGLEINTGVLKHRFKGVKKNQLTGTVDSYIDTDEYYVFYDTPFYIHETGTIIGLVADRFYEIDLNAVNIEPKLYGMWDKMKAQNIDKGNISPFTAHQGNKLYFSMYDQLKFGILDIDSKEITYVSEEIGVAETTSSRRQLRDLQVSGDKVYVLDSLQTLHIFQKETENV